MNTYTYLGLKDATDELQRIEELNRAREEIEKANGENKPFTPVMFRVQ